MRAESLHTAGYKMTAATAAKRLPLLMSSLHGLTKYAHLIDVDYFADLLQVWVCMVRTVSGVAVQCQVLWYSVRCCGTVSGAAAQNRTLQGFMQLYACGAVVDDHGPGIFDVR